MKTSLPRVISTALAAALVLTIAVGPVAAGSIKPVTDFGANPGKLNMYEYVPSTMTEHPALVVALHG